MAKARGELRSTSSSGSSLDPLAEAGSAQGLADMAIGCGDLELTRRVAAMLADGAYGPAAALVEAAKRGSVEAKAEVAVLKRQCGQHLGRVRRYEQALVEWGEEQARQAAEKVMMQYKAGLGTLDHGKAGAAAPAQLSAVGKQRSASESLDAAMRAR